MIYRGCFWKPRNDEDIISPRRCSCPRLKPSELLRPETLTVGSAILTFNSPGSRADECRHALSREVLADTSAFLVQFREVLFATESKSDANGLAPENSLLRAIYSRSDRVLQNTGHNYTLTMTTLRDPFLLPKVRVAPEIVKED